MVSFDQDFLSQISLQTPVEQQVLMILSKFFSLQEDDLIRRVSNELGGDETDESIQDAIGALRGSGLIGRIDTDRVRLNPQVFNYPPEELTELAALIRNTVQLESEHWPENSLITMIQERAQNKDRDCIRALLRTIRRSAILGTPDHRVKYASDSSTSSDDHAVISEGQAKALGHQVDLSIDAPEAPLVSPEELIAIAATGSENDDEPELVEDGEIEPIDDEAYLESIFSGGENQVEASSALSLFYEGGEHVASRPVDSPAIDLGFSNQLLLSIAGLFKGGEYKTDMTPGTLQVQFTCPNSRTQTVFIRQGQIGRHSLKVLDMCSFVAPYENIKGLNILSLSSRLGFSKPSVDFHRGEKYLILSFRLPLYIENIEIIKRLAYEIALDADELEYMLTGEDVE